MRLTFMVVCDIVYSCDNTGKYHAVVAWLYSLLNVEWVSSEISVDNYTRLVLEGKEFQYLIVEGKTFSKCIYYMRV